MIVGIDEVGRGAWAGPLCVAAVGLGGDEIVGLTDSKKLTKTKRKHFELLIKQDAPLVGIGWVSARRLDQIGMSLALKEAAWLAVNQLDQSLITQIIIDGTIMLLNDPRATTMKQADLLVPSVSAASIIAKEARDRYMRQAEAVFPGYGFAAHVGYGTKLHQVALASLGASAMHRMSFRPMADQVETQEDDSAQIVTTTQIGQSAETVAAEWLVRNGFEIIERNWKTRVCEIDIVARKQETIYFVEVKYRRTYDQGGGISAITPKKLRQMKFAANVWFKYFGIQDGNLAVIESSGEPAEVMQFIDEVLV